MIQTIMVLIILGILALFIWMIVAGIQKAVRQHKERAYFKAQTKRVNEEA